MINPYVLLTPELLQGMLKQPMFFVRQYYARGENPYEAEKQIPLLFTHYVVRDDDHERALRHLRLLWKDAYRFIYDSRNKEHYEKLLQAARQPAGYRIYVNLLPAPWKASDGLKAKVRKYMLHRLPWWHYSPADKLKVTLKDRYGELYLALLWKGQQTEVHLTEIENFSLCATT